MIADARQHFNRVVGIDLGGGKGKTTAVAVGSVTESGLEIHSYGTRAHSGAPWYDDELVPFLLDQPDETLVAMDAPLGLPACMRCPLPVCPGYRECRDPAVQWMLSVGEDLEHDLRPRDNRRKPLITPYTQRVGEILLRCEHGIQPRETLGQGMGPLTARAAHLRRALAGRYALDRDLLEVYPKATIHKLAGQEAAKRYKRRTDTWQERARILEQLAGDLHFKTWREESLRNDHSFDAILCAYTGYLWITQGWDREARYDEIARLEGWIWFPHGNGHPPA